STTSSASRPMLTLALPAMCAPSRAVRCHGRAAAAVVRADCDAGPVAVVAPGTDTVAWSESPGGATLGVGQPPGHEPGGRTDGTGRPGDGVHPRGPPSVPDQDAGVPRHLRADAARGTLRVRAPPGRPGDRAESGRRAGGAGDAQQRRPGGDRGSGVVD